MALTDNLRACWEFNESSGNAADASGNGTTLTNNGSTPFVAGKMNNAAEFASGDYFECADNSYVSLTGDATWSVWWYPTTLNAQNSFFDKWNFSAVQREYEVWVDYSGGASKISLQISNNGSSSSYNYLSTTGISVNNWYHVVWVFTASTGTLEVYLNGSSLGTATFAITAIKDGTSNFSIGKFTGGGGNLAGKLDQAAIWARTLSTTEVGELYNSGNGIEYPFSATSSPTPLRMMTGMGS